MWHLNSPYDFAGRLLESSKKHYPNAIYLVNSTRIYESFKDENMYYLPRFIDPDELPKPRQIKENDFLWFGNVWKHHEDKFEKYMQEHTNWISRGLYNGEPISRDEALEIVNNTKNVYAIGLSAMEAKHLGCNVIEYDDINYDVMYPKDAIKILERELGKTQKNKVREHI